jgi:predicted RNase H-like nuclease (RuvC/YqgF family)
LELEKAKQETERLKQETERIKQETERIKRETQEMQVRDDEVRSINKLIDKAHIAINGNNNVVNNITNNVTNHHLPDSGHRGFVQPAHERDVCFNRAGKTLAHG